MRHYKHLTYTDRLNIEKWLREGMPKGEIAARLRVHRNTITNELKRGRYSHLNSDYTTEDRYSPDIAYQKYRKHLAAKGPDYKIGKNIAFANYIEDLILNKHFSPAAALAAAQKSGHFDITLCYSTIYNYIDKGDVFLSLTNKSLPYKGRRKRSYRRVRAATKAPRGISIERRPEEINTRQEPFHWEMDTVVSPRGGKKALLVLTERVSRYEMISLIPRHTTDSVVRCLDRMERKIGTRRFREMFRSITVDNGAEFNDCAGMERSLNGGRRTTLYYCHPYSSYERGSNEKQNQIIRRHFPKGTNFDKVSAASVQRVQDWINDYPRKLLSWETSRALFDALVAEI